jgi:TPR repeat protein
MELLENLKKIEDIELYIIGALIIFILWLIVNTIKHYKGEKRKIKHLHRFAKEGETLAQYHLAQRYNKGNMMKKNKRNAAFWSQKASFSGDKKAQALLDEILKKKKR